MINEIKVIRAKEIGEMINTLTNDYGMSTECLSHLLGVKSEGHKLEVPTGFAERSSFNNSIIFHFPLQVFSLKVLLCLLVLIPLQAFPFLVYPSMHFRYQIHILIFNPDKFLFFKFRRCYVS